MGLFAFVFVVVFVGFVLWLVSFVRKSFPAETLNKKKEELPEFANCEYVLVTGASGFAGRYVVDLYLGQGIAVVAQDLRKPDFTNKSVVNVAVDGTDEEEMTLLFERLKGKLRSIIHIGNSPLPTFIRSDAKVSF